MRVISQSRHGVRTRTQGVLPDPCVSYLEPGQAIVLWLGLIIVVTGLFAGANRYGTAVRRTLSGGLENIGSSIAGSAITPAGR